jgi:hypothetical protein
MLPAINTDATIVSKNFFISFVIKFKVCSIFLMLANLHFFLKKKIRYFENISHFCKKNYA